MAKKYKNYIIWRGTNPRLIDIVLSEYDPGDVIYPSNAGTWWETIRHHYASIVEPRDDWNHMLVTGEDEFINDMKNCGAIP